MLLHYCKAACMLLLHACFLILPPLLLYLLPMKFGMNWLLLQQGPGSCTCKQRVQVHSHTRSRLSTLSRSANNLGPDGARAMVAPLERLTELHTLNIGCRGVEGGSG